jgi:TRAP-type transport system periplasmic protein
VSFIEPASGSLYEVQSHLTLTNHLVGFGLVMANKCFLDGLNNGDENKIEHSLSRAAQWGTNEMEARESTLLGDLQGFGMTVVTPDAEAIRAEAEGAINGLFASKWTVTTWEEVLSF